MNFFIITSALVCSILIFLAWSVWKLKGRNKILEWERDQERTALMSLETHVAESPDNPDRWKYILANAVSNQKSGRGYRIEWGKPFDDHLQRTVVREALISDVRDGLDEIADTETNGPPHVMDDGTFEAHGRKKGKKK